jgi:hypothetical protein
MIVKQLRLNVQANKWVAITQKANGMLTNIEITSFDANQILEGNRGFSFSREWENGITYLFFNINVIE